MNYKTLSTMDHDSLLVVAQEIKEKDQAFKYNKRSKKNTKEQVFKYHNYPINCELYVEFEEDIPENHKDSFEKGKEFAEYCKKKKEDTYSDDPEIYKTYMKMNIWEKRGYAFVTSQR